MSEIPKDPSFILLTTNASFYPSLLRGNIERPGLYNWMRAFQRGEEDMEKMVRLWSEFSNNPTKLNRYDIVHINLAGGDFGLAVKVKDYLDDSTKLVVNMDYAIENLQSVVKKTQQKIELVATDISVADVAFGVEPAQVRLMDWLMEVTKQDKRCQLIPHPIDCEYMSKSVDSGGLFIPYDQRLDWLAFCWHRYDQQLVIPRIIMGNLPKPEGQQGLLRVLFGWSPEGMTIHNVEDYLEVTVPMKTWRAYLYMLSHCMWGFEYRFHHAASRFVLECASLGIPVVTTNNCYLGTVIWPELSCPPEDFKGLHERLCLIISNDSARKLFARQGMERVKEFSLQASRERYLHHLYEVEEKEDASS